MSDLTPAQRLRDFCADYALPKIILRANESFVAGAVVSGDIAYLTIERYTVTDTPTGRRISARATQLRVYRLVAGRWYPCPTETISAPDVAFEPLAMPSWAGRTVAEYVAHERFARECHRPGTKKTPLDSYNRTLDGSNTSDMERYW